MFKIVVASYNCLPELNECVKSIQAQTCSDYQVVIVDDASPNPDQAAFVKALAHLSCDDQWIGICHDENRGALFSQHEAVQAMDCKDEDIIVYLDGDDRFADEFVLDTLIWNYDTFNPLMTYGSYEPDPPDPLCPPARPYPNACVRANDFRNAHKWGIQFNHLRTVKYEVYKHLTVEDFTETDGETFFHVAGDAAVMIPCLELAGGRHKFISDTLVKYTSNSDQADWRVNSPEIVRIHNRIFKELPKKEPLCV